MSTINWEAINEDEKLENNQCCVCKQIISDDGFDKLNEAMCEACAIEIVIANIS